MDTDNLMESAEIYMAEHLLRTEGFQPDDSLPAIFPTQATSNESNLDELNAKAFNLPIIENSLQQFLDTQIGTIENDQNGNLVPVNALRALADKVIHRHQADEIVLQRDERKIVVVESTQNFVYTILNENDLNDAENGQATTNDMDANDQTQRNSVNTKTIDEQQQVQHMDISTTIQMKELKEKPTNALKSKPKGKRGRPPKSLNKSSKSEAVVELKRCDLELSKLIGDSDKQRTRSGRVVNHTQTTTPSENDRQQQQNFQDLLESIANSDIERQKSLKLEPGAEMIDEALSNEIENLEEMPLEEQWQAKRKFSPDAACPTCNKIFLGKRMQKHFLKYPDHVKKEEPPSFNSELENISLFQFLVNKLNSNALLSEDQKSDLFLNEIDDFVNQLQLRSSKLIRNASGLHFVNGRCSRVLGIPEGQYALDLNALDQIPEPEPEPDPEPLPENIFNISNFHPARNMHMTEPSGNTRSLDISAISMDETLTDEAVQKLNLSVGGKLLPPSEESLLRAVDDLGIKKLESVLKEAAINLSVIPHYDHVTDNAVEAVPMKETKILADSPIIDLNTDFFKFSNNNNNNNNNNIISSSSNANNNMDDVMDNEMSN